MKYLNVYHYYEQLQHGLEDVLVKSTETLLMLVGMKRAGLSRKEQICCLTNSKHATDLIVFNSPRKVRSTINSPSFQYFRLDK